MRELVGAYDLGGTKCLCGLVDRTGEVVAEERIPSHQPGGPDEVIFNMASTLKRLLKEVGAGSRELRAIGVGSPGPLDPQAGIIIDAANLGWRNVPIRECLAAHFGPELPVAVEIDCHAAAVGEMWLGAARGLRDFAYVVLGTGVGSGLVLDGKVYRGTRGLAGEFGHMIIDPNGPPCTCGKFGCLEAYVSGPAIAARGAQAVATGRQTTLRSLAGGDPAGVTAEAVFEAAAGGDGIAREIVLEVAGHLGQGLANLVQLLNPETVLVGGGVAAGWDLLEDEVRRALSRFSMPAHLEGLCLRAGALGRYAGLLGVAREAWDRVGG